ncbi:hypothetical protein OAN307_c15720 [Octadecabacter antarcticus 307]|uniref:DNA-directed RNA polymerase n=1 Tax=Octadecabacter antarcticus 307 TaxID=391626 RepID=M9RBP2_9RHOB|nr:hypothetical protein [Octadecabacter antarcticus]AGI67245.1 hypothetical protein OAN307_c15720 [Octadecabacter antarcticus 307]
MTDLPEMDVWHSKPLDVHVWSEHPKINQVVNTVYDSLTDDNQTLISGKSNNQGKASGRTHLKVVLVDLYVAWKTDPLLCIGVARGNDAYKVGSRYNALHISNKIRKVIDTLTDEGFIDFRKGSNVRTGSGHGSRTSRMRATKKLTDLFLPIGLELYELDLHHKRECIILNEHDVDDLGEFVKTSTGAKKSKPIDYNNTPETIRMRGELTAYNDLLRETYIDIPTLEEPRISRKVSNKKDQYVSIGQHNKFVRRVFSRGDWNLNGRYYGGWWQQIGKDYRKKISINNMPTVEIDYRGLHVAILSAQRGATNDPVDRYDLGELLLPQFDLKQQRTIVKSLVLTAINAKDQSATYAAFRKDQPTGSLEKKLTNVELSKLLEAFLKRLPHLRDDLCSDKGIELMFIDSQITESIIKSFVEHNIPILSVHDSYIVETHRVKLLRNAMSKATIALVGRDLAVEQEVPGYYDIMNMQHQDRDLYLDAFTNVLSMSDQTDQYQDRLRKFMKYRKDNFHETYWIGKLPVEQ